MDTFLFIGHPSKDSSNLVNLNLPEDVSAFGDYRMAGIFFADRAAKEVL